MDTERKTSIIGTMQPLYRIPGEMLRGHVERLSACTRVKEAHTNLYSLLFLSGLHASIHFYKESGTPPLHFLDDGLSDTTRSCLRALGKLVRSRAIQNLKFARESKEKLPNWVAVQLSFFGFFDNCPVRAKEWISRGDTETNRVRLACAMGIESFFNTDGFMDIAYGIMREPLGLDSDESAAIKAFLLNSKNALPAL